MEPDVLDLLPDAVLLLDGDGVILGCNDRALALLHLDADVVGRDVNELVGIRSITGLPCVLPPPPPRIGDRIPEWPLVVTTGGRDRMLACTGRHADGRWSIVLRPAGRQDAQARLQGDVIATVSHEIRAPLTSVKGFTRTLVKRWDRFTDEQKLVMLETIDADADRVTRLLLDLLEVSRIDAGRVALRRSSVDLGGLVRAVVGRTALSDDAAGRQLSLTVAPGLPRIDADADRIEQVLTNLLDNALRHAPDGAVRVDVHHDVGDHVVLTVADDGPGVPGDLVPRLFEKFGRGRGTRQTGTGLGLYITRGLVRAHGGDIELVGTGPGATFRVVLPVGRDAPH